LVVGLQANEGLLRSQDRGAGKASGTLQGGSQEMSLLNQAAVQKEALETAKRYKKDVTQISQDWKDDLEQAVRMMIFRKVMAHRKGKTLKP
jgi:hypothetical protein